MNLGLLTLMSPELIGSSGSHYHSFPVAEMTQLLARDRTRFGQRSDRAGAAINSMLDSHRMAVA